MTNLKTMTKIAILSFSMSLVGCATTKEMSTNNIVFTEKQINDFATIANNSSALKTMLINSSKDKPYYPFNNKDDISSEQAKCLQNQLTDRAIHNFFVKRTRQYLTLYPHRYEHDLAIMNSAGAKSIFDKSNNRNKTAVSDTAQQEDTRNDAKLLLEMVSFRDMQNRMLQDFLFYDFTTILSSVLAIQKGETFYIVDSMMTCGTKFPESIKSKLN